MWPNDILKGRVTLNSNIDPYAYFIADLFYWPFTIPSGVTCMYFISIESRGNFKSFIIKYPLSTLWYPNFGPISPTLTP